jgi:hypothetical protein
MAFYEAFPSPFLAFGVEKNTHPSWKEHEHERLFAVLSLSIVKPVVSPTCARDKWVYSSFTVFSKKSLRRLGFRESGNQQNENKETAKL